MRPWYSLLCWNCPPRLYEKAQRLSQVTKIGCFITNCSTLGSILLLLEQCYTFCVGNEWDSLSLLFSLVNIFFTWKSSPYVRKQETKHSHLDFTFTSASETPKYCSWAPFPWWQFPSPLLQLFGHWNGDCYWSSFYFFKPQNMLLKGLVDISVPKQNTCKIEKKRAREWGPFLLFHWLWNLADMEKVHQAHFGFSEESCAW